PWRTGAPGGGARRTCLYVRGRIVNFFRGPGVSSAPLGILFESYTRAPIGLTQSQLTHKFAEAKSLVPLPHFTKERSWQPTGKIRRQSIHRNSNNSPTN